LVFRERNKQILVLSTGKNVAPGPIEDAFAASEVVEQCMVVGDGRKFVSAVVVPNVEGIRKWADAEGIDLPADAAALCADDRVRRRVERAVEAVNDGFERHETIKQFSLVPEEFTQDNDLLTPTMKKKRRNILRTYDDEIDAMYED
jgi:long-chain acyl-CoA synthetase